MGDLAELGRSSVQVGEVPMPNVGRVETAPVTQIIDLSPCRVIYESAAGHRSFLYREALFEGRYTQDRATQAFEDYKETRNKADKIARRQRLSRELDICKALGKPSSDVRAIDSALRENENGYNPRGGEVVLQCRDFEEAQRRVLELVGPVKEEDRHYRYAGLGEFRQIRDEGRRGPVNGFEASINYVDAGKGHQFSRSWRIDYDPRKGPHFNVIIRPGARDGGPDSYLQQMDPESLKLALLFPGDQQTYRRSLHAVEISAIASLDRGVQGNYLDYLPLNR